MEEKNDDLQIYELGYHLVPTIGEENLNAEVDKIHQVLSANNAQVINEEHPVLKGLFYEIGKKIETKTVKFNKAFFGWIKFELQREGAKNMNEAIKNLPNILRFLLIKTVKENTMHIPKTPLYRKEVEPQGVGVPVEKQEISEEEIDKSIEELITSDAI